MPWYVKTLPILTALRSLLVQKLQYMLLKTAPIMKKSTSRLKAADTSFTKDQPKNDRPELYNRARPARNHPDPDSFSSGNSGIHNGSASAFDATEEAHDDEDSDEDNDDFARDYK